MLERSNSFRDVQKTLFFSLLLKAILDDGSLFFIPCTLTLHRWTIYAIPPWGKQLTAKKLPLD